MSNNSDTLYNFQQMDQLSQKIKTKFAEMEDNIEGFKARKDELMGEWIGLSAAAYDMAIDTIKNNVSTVQQHFDELLRNILTMANEEMAANEQQNAKAIEAKIGQ